MNSVKLSLFTLFVLGALLGAANAQRKLVFAHYMLWSPSSGWQPEAFVKDIQIAQSYGIDGFAINTADWRAVDWALPRSDLLYQAAQQLGTGFKLFFSLDMTNSLPNNPNDIVEMVTRYHNHPNQFFVDGKHYVSTFVGNFVNFGRPTSQQGWTEVFIQPLKNQGIEVCFVPFFDPPLSRAPGSKQIGNPTQGDIGKILDQFPFVSGLFNWLAWPYFYGDFQNVSSEDIQNYRQITSARGKLHMAPISPWFSKHMGGAPETLPNWVFGNYKGPGMWIKRWQDIVETQPDFVEIVTWNDYAERSYVVDASTAPWAARDYDCQDFPHVAFMDLGNYFGKHYKSGQKGQPPVDREKIYIFHRSHSKDAKAPDGLGPQDHAETHDDETYVTVLLKSPATVTITSGGQTQSFDINQTGLTTVSMRFSEGTQSAQLKRNGGVIASVSSAKPISNNIQKYDYNVYSNFAAAN